ncbi:MAG: histidinol-phosphatase [Candidatus Anoxymicrobium japonicum]|uniref:Histidinol-phosphatase n=1 Tax=Candidatus Anoxymicrobium japonicum TaxID=2013648 RepID=A0A2N3G842_9ACTN|nr:MAG: histidinol-phosphatase [Candidatus Anoxymicrobium japonicum]
MKVDFHVHTVFSPDSIITFERLVASCRERGVDAVAIMDHDVIEGALEFSRLAEESRARGEWAPRILVGEEVRTTDGEICGLFLKEWIPDHLSPVETMERIRAQGGLVYVPHPFDLLKLKRLKAKDLEALDDMIDIIEEFNGKPRLPIANALARRFLVGKKFARGAGSDSHEPTRLGAAYVEMDDFDGPGDLLEKLARGVVHGKRYNPLASAYTRFRM